jgi:hypothetical protein
MEGPWEIIRFPKYAISKENGPLVVRSIFMSDKKRNKIKGVIF